ncbi:MAG: hypothetical protein OXH37_00210, partial [Gammaproteobacteria bacterium]|nr:hypothetical protein [Gammaproteobacteria bacterium]
MKNAPNLFTYATKELSQDAVICWLIEWSAHDSDAELDSDSELARLGRNFVVSLLNHKRDAKTNLNDGPLEVEIHRQDNGIDVLARINKRHVLLIEDKTDSQPHSGQLERYKEGVLSDQTRLKGVLQEDLCAIYFKTGNHSREAVREIENKSGYKVFDRADFLDVLSDYGGDNAILSDFKKHLELIEKKTQSFHAWRRTDCKGDGSWYPWEGLYRELERRLFDSDSALPGRGWGYVPNPSGGFLGFWWVPPELPEGCPAYLQLEFEKLCFKVGAEGSSTDQQDELKWKWHKRITGQHERVVKPNRMRRGATMTVAVHEEGWLRYDNQGNLSIDDTVEALRQAERWLLSAA